MKQKQYILHSLTIEVIAVLLASMIAFQICNMLSIRMSLLPFVMAVGYVILKLLYHLCISIARYIIETPLSHLALADEVTDKKTFGCCILTYPRLCRSTKKAYGIIPL